MALHSPWGAERTWAVVPFSNESGVSVVDSFRIGDDFVTEVDAVDGLHCLPLNRTIAAMRSLGLGSVRTEADARALLRVLQVDALVVGSVTAYDPYRPFQLGIAAQVYLASDAAPTASNANELTMAVSDRGGPQAAPPPGPSCQMTRVYDARNHDVLQRIQVYAAGRNAPKSGFRDAIYLNSMEAYARFVAYDVVRELLDVEFSKVDDRPDASRVEGGATPEPESEGIWPLSELRK